LIPVRIHISNIILFNGRFERYLRLKVSKTNGIICILDFNSLNSIWKTFFLALTTYKKKREVVGATPLQFIGHVSPIPDNKGFGYLHFLVNQLHEYQISFLQLNLPNSEPDKSMSDCRCLKHRFLSQAPSHQER